MSQHSYPAPPAWMPPQVRRMTEADLPVVLAMLRSDARAGHYAGGTLFEEQAGDYAAFLARLVAGGRMPGPGGQEYAVTASVGMEWGRLVSYAFVRTPQRDASLAELWLFGVDPALRFQRLGKRLLDQVLAGPACAGRAVMARCHPASVAMRAMLRHRRFELIGTGSGGVSLLARGFSAGLRRSLAV